MKVWTSKRTGVLDIDDIRDALFLCGEPVTEEEMRYMIRMADADAGGEIGTFVMCMFFRPVLMMTLNLCKEIYSETLRRLRVAGG